MTEPVAKTSGLWQLTKNFAFPHWPWFAAGLVFLAITNLITLQIPQLAKEIVNQLAEAGAMEGMAQIALAIIGLGTLQMFIRALSRIFIFWPGRKLEAEVKEHLFTKVLRLPVSFFLQHGMGDLISRISNDVNHLRVFYAFGFLQFANIAFLTAFIITQMLSVHVALTILCLLPLVAMFLITRMIVPKMHAASKENQVAVGALTNRVTESFVNIHVIQTNSIEDTFLQRCKTENDKVYESHMKLVFIRTYLFPLMTCLAGMSQLAILFYGGYQVIQGHLTVGDILAFNIYIGLLTFPLTAVGIILAIVQRAKTAIDRVKDIDIATEEQVSPRAKALPHDVKGDVAIAIRGLTYRFPQSIAEADADTSTPVIQIPLLDIPKGEKLGIVGPIGSGKSTLLHLITRLYDPPEGTIFVGGHDVMGMPPQELRQQVGYALQSVHLFSESIAGNLNFGITALTPDKLQSVVSNAALTSDVEGFTKGLSTEIGERGLRLSGGQKQRLAIARLLARSHPIVLLDDVLSAVDQKTEQQLIANLFQKDQTALVVSHRESALQACDRVILLERGAIADEGTYPDLLKRHPHLENLDQTTTALSQAN